MGRRDGFTLIELVVALAILGGLVAVAVPMYLGARKAAIVAEGDGVIQELKGMAWAYVNPAPRVVKILALANRSGRAQCGMLAPTDRIVLFLHHDGSSFRLAPGETL